MPWSELSSDPAPFRDDRKPDRPARLTELASEISAYLRELRDRDVPMELAEQLVRDYQTLRLQQQTTVVVSHLDPQAVAAMVRDELLRLRRL